VDNENYDYVDPVLRWILYNKVMVGCVWNFGSIQYLE